MDNLERMKMKKRDSIQDKRDKVLKDMRRKMQLAEKNLNKNKNEKESITKEKIEKSIEVEKKIKHKIQKTLSELEKKRLEEQKRNHEKCKIFANIFIQKIISSFSKIIFCE
jgi:hypothetical protein